MKSIFLENWVFLALFSSNQLVLSTQVFPLISILLSFVILSSFLRVLTTYLICFQEFCLIIGLFWPIRDHKSRLLVKDAAHLQESRFLDSYEY